MKLTIEDLDLSTPAGAALIEALTKAIAAAEIQTPPEAGITRGIIDPINTDYFGGSSPPRNTDYNYSQTHLPTEDVSGSYSNVQVFGGIVPGGGASLPQHPAAKVASDTMPPPETPQRPEEKSTVAPTLAPVVPRQSLQDFQQAADELTLTEEEGAVEVDSAGLPWDKRINTKTKGKTAKGRWKRAPKLDDEFYNSIIAELNGGKPIVDKKPTNRKDIIAAMGRAFTALRAGGAEIVKANDEISAFMVGLGYTAGANSVPVDKIDEVIKAIEETFCKGASDE